MPELPEVEVLVRHLSPMIQGEVIAGVTVHRAKSLRGTPEKQFQGALTGARIAGVTRRGKYLLFALCQKGGHKSFSMLGHLGMTGRMYLQPNDARLAKHTAVVLSLGKHNFVFEDTRCFGRMTLDLSAIDALGPEPLGEGFTVEYLRARLNRSVQAIKVKLLDQALIAGVGNIYACEALFRSGISPRRQSRRLTRAQLASLRDAIRRILAEAIELGCATRLDFAGSGVRDGLFYFGGSDVLPTAGVERFAVYDREGEPCPVCETPIQRIIQSARSSFFCSVCQRG